MINIKTPQQINIMREGGKILGEILLTLKNFTKVGITTLEIDGYAEKLMQINNARPSFKGYRGYKYATCISINNEVVHGIPANRTLKTGDIVGLDCGIKYRGFHSDSAITFGIGKISSDSERLIKTTQKSLEEAIKLIRPGEKLGTIQAKIQEIIENNHMGIVKDLSGHGIGRNLQEEPAIPNFGKVKTGILLKQGMTLCLEPMVCLGKGNTKISDDGWTILSIDGSLSAHFEHTIAVTNDLHMVLTSTE